ncbi:hypothetical protein LAZ67_10001594 [Cordylochernes scorpioides]|uniref:Reverse transcriptase domain-containing protein n=1 Tax=Cordylochernes scorpioides TaxID=51811 RepID=A0ABY6KWF3_9ARAC|nr:hypothetical protein LAZ67_10001594 [Cordylochernes scorpioides]
MHFSYRGFSRSTSPSRGCAQGSISGPLLWNIFFNPLLSFLFPPGVHVQAFADDLQLLISVPSPTFFCNPLHLLVNNTPETLTILGVTFDGRLSFTPHLYRACEKASSLLGRVSHCSNAVFGLGFVARRRFYCGVVEPAITYAAPIWCDAVKLRVGKASLHSTQRKFRIHAIRGFRTVPTLFAIALLRVLPLKVHLLSSLLRPPDPLPFTPEPPFPLSSSFRLFSTRTSLSRFSPPPLPTSNTTPMAPSRGAASGPAECFDFQSALSYLCSFSPSLSAAIISDCLSLLSALSPPTPLTPSLPNAKPSSTLSSPPATSPSGNLGNCRPDTLAKGATVAPSLPPQYALAPKPTHHKFLSHHFWSLWDEEFISAKPSFFLKLGITPSSLSSSQALPLPPDFSPAILSLPLSLIGKLFPFRPHFKAWTLTLDFAIHSNRFVSSNIPQSSSDSDTSN